MQILKVSRHSSLGTGEYCHLIFPMRGIKAKLKLGVVRR